MRLPFTLDPQVIHHIIHSQAGSIGKAIIELVMNSVDARATQLTLQLDSDGFRASDDGTGFASREDVVRYFGRFGTPHEEGDATFGRFRLGRGQIMAHAKTVWRSLDWQMTVDTREMGYAYDLDDLPVPQPGCDISGQWYEPLGQMELYEVLQELRDLVRYTPMQVELNGKIITRVPALEQWDLEDDIAYYRFRREGSVAIYNQGVLVRHDPGHVWGAGGTIVSKKAIGLNVSRTEILRKSCPVWQAIAKQAKALAQAYAEDDTARKGENARAHAARRIKVAQGEELVRLMLEERVLTLLPGTRHMSFFRLPNCTTISVAPDNGSSLARAENIAGAGVATLLHPRTMQRFDCADMDEFVELWNELKERIKNHLREQPRGDWAAQNIANTMQKYAFIPYSVLDANFKFGTQVLPDTVLPAETRRAWTALRWALDNYATRIRLANTSERIRGNRQGTVYNYGTALARMAIVVGRSASAEAWTDGQSYIAINEKRILELRTDGLKAAMTIFTLLDHELAHEGDSLDATHDEAFFNRYHDLSLEYAGVKQFYLQQWVSKYGLSLERGKRSGWSKRHLKHLEKASAIEGDGSSFEVPATQDEPLLPEPSPQVLAFINAGYRNKGEETFDLAAFQDAIAAWLRHHEEQTQRQKNEEAASLERGGQALTEEETLGLTEEELFEVWVDEDDGDWQAEMAEMEAHEAEQEKAERLYREEALATLAGQLKRPLSEVEKTRIHALDRAEKIDDMLAFVKAMGRMPETHPAWRQGEPEREEELWLWQYSGRPTVTGELSLVVLARLARNIGLNLEQYLLTMDHPA